MELFRNLIGPEGNVHLQWPQECLRAVIIFVVGLALVRLSGKRTFSRSSPLDIVVTVIIGSNLSRALTGSAPFVPTLVASALFVALHRVIATLCVGSPWLERIVKGRPVNLIENRRPDAAALKREAVSQADLYELLRSKGVDRPEDVRLAVLENSGQTSVLKA